MARIGIFKRVGAGVAAGTVASLSCNQELEYSDEHQPRPRSPRSPTPVSSSPTVVEHGNTRREILRRAVAFREKIRRVSGRATWPKTREAEEFPGLRQLETAAVAEIDTPTTPTFEILHGAIITSIVADISAEHLNEDAEGVLIEGTVIRMPESTPHAANTTRFLCLDAILGIADSFSSEMAQALSARIRTHNLSVLSIPSAVAPVSPVQSSTALVPVRRSRMRAPYTIPQITLLSIYPRVNAHNDNLVSSLLADRSVLRPSLALPGVSQDESSLVILTPVHNGRITLTQADSFLYSPRPLITYEAETPVSNTATQTSIIAARSTEQVVEELEEESVSPIFVDSATQTEEIQQESLSQAASADNLVAKNNHSARSSLSANSLPESAGSSEETQPTSRSISPPEFSLEDELGYHKDEIDRLNSLVRSLNIDAQDREEIENGLTEKIERLEREKRDLEDDTEGLRNQMARMNMTEEVEQRVTDEMDAWKRQRKIQVEECNKAIEQYEARAVDMLAKMLQMQDALIQAYSTPDNKEKVGLLFEKLVEVATEKSQLLQRNGELVAHVRHLQSQTALIPMIEREVQALIRQRDALQNDRIVLERERNHLLHERNTILTELNQWRQYYQASQNHAQNP